jgi:TrmH family RNA methyltransferase
MLSQNQIKHITALKVKKYREEYGQFIAEGHKLVSDLMNSEFIIEGIYATSDWIAVHTPMTREKKIPVFETLPREMERISALSSPSPVLAVLKIPNDDCINFPTCQLANLPAYQFTSSLSLALDDIRDPGNFGTIIRIADWFGIDTVLCSEGCVELFNPKVVQATMGSIARVKVIRCNLVQALTSLTGSHNMVPVYGTLMDGEQIFTQTLTEHGIIIIGNESRGISSELVPFITKKLLIPSYGNSELGKAESLNAAVASAIICAEFRRKIIKN